MTLPKLPTAGYQYPLKLLLIGNEDTWNSMLSVISDLTPEQFTYKHPGIKQRSIREIISHTLSTQYYFYTEHLVLGQKLSKQDPITQPKDIAEAQKQIINTYRQVTKLWQQLKPELFTQEIKTDWGQVMTCELVLFQSITHTHYHVSEINFLRGLGGFSTQVMG